MRNIKLTECEWKYLNDALTHSGDFTDSWDVSTTEWKRKNKILRRTEYKIATAKKEAV